MGIIKHYASLPSLFVAALQPRAGGGWRTAQAIRQEHTGVAIMSHGVTM